MRNLYFFYFIGVQALRLHSTSSWTWFRISQRTCFITVRRSCSELARLNTYKIKINEWRIKFRMTCGGRMTEAQLTQKPETCYWLLVIGYWLLVIKPKTQNRQPKTIKLNFELWTHAWDDGLLPAVQGGGTDKDYNWRTQCLQVCQSGVSDWWTAVQLCCDTFHFRESYGRICAS